MAQFTNDLREFIAASDGDNEEGVLTFVNAFLETLEQSDDVDQEFIDKLKELVDEYYPIIDDEFEEDDEDEGEDDEDDDS